MQPSSRNLGKNRAKSEECMSYGLEALRVDLVALAVSEPQEVARIVLTCLEKHPHLEADIRWMLDRTLSTLQQAPIALAHPEPSQATLDAITQTYHAVTAKTDVRHRRSLTVDTVVQDISVKKGQQAIIVGGNVVALVAVARLTEALSGELKQNLVRVSDAIAEQLSGTLSRRTMSRGRAVAVRPAPAGPSADDAEDPAVQCMQVIAAFWSPAAEIRRLKGEAAPAYLERVVTAAQTAAAAGDDHALETLAAVAREFPDFVGGQR
jgi:hypothetical protein